MPSAHPRRRQSASPEPIAAQLRLIGTNAPVILSHWSVDNRLLFASRAFADRWEKAPEELVGQSVADVLGAEAWAAIQPHVARVLAGETVTFEMEIPYAGFGRRFMRVSYTPDVGIDGRVRGYLSAASDISDRRRTELALRESEEKFRTLTNHAPVGIFMTGADGDCLFVNDRWTTMTGLSSADAAGAGWTRALHPDDRARVTAEWYASAAERRPFALEFRFLRADGKVTWVQGSAVASHDATGALTGYLGTVADITDRKAAEFALRESEKRFRTLASRAPVGIFMTDARGDTVFVNEAWCTMAGLTAVQAQGHGWINAVHPDDRARLRAGWDEAVGRGAASNAEFRFLRPDGSVAWVQGSAVQLRDVGGRASGYVGTVADITARKLAEDEVRRQAQHLSLAVEAAQLGDWSWDPATDALAFSARGAEIFGVTGRPPLTRSQLRELLHPDDRVRASEANARAIASKGDYDIEYRVRRPSGEWIWIAAKGRGIYDAAGRLVRMMGVVQDITARKLAEEGLRASEAELRAAQVQLHAHATELERKVEERTASLRDMIAQMEEFSYSVSHDLRSPLRAMHGYAQALLEDYGPQLDETARGYLERIQRSSVRMEKLTHDVLNYSRIARGELQLGPVDLDRLLSDLIDQHAELQPASADVAIRRPLHAVVAHEPSLAQCLGNLLTNAAKFVRAGERPRIGVGTEVRGDRVRIWIEDDGIGIPPQYHAALFQIFERLPTQVRYEGTGIGLAIVRKAAEKMNGTCGVESDGERGSRFWVELSKA